MNQYHIYPSFKDDGRTLYVTPLARYPQEHSDRRDHRACTPHDTSVMYTLDRHELRAGQHLFMLGRQLYLYEWLTIGKLPQQGPYIGPYYTKAHYQLDPNLRGGQTSRPDTLPGHLPARLSSRRTGILNQRPHERSRVACLTGARRHHPHGPSAH